MKRRVSARVTGGDHTPVTVTVTITLTSGTPTSSSSSTPHQGLGTKGSLYVTLRTISSSSSSGGTAAVLLSGTTAAVAADGILGGGRGTAPRPLLLPMAIPHQQQQMQQGSTTLEGTLGHRSAKSIPPLVLLLVGVAQLEGCRSCSQCRQSIWLRWVCIGTGCWPQQWLCASGRGP
jgi:hypothetical protein